MQSNIEILKTLIRDFHQRVIPGGLIERERRVPMDGRKVVAVIGPRRAGKTCFFQTLIRQLDRTVGRRHLLYLNFEDDRLRLGPEDLQAILDAWEQAVPDVPLSDVFFFFDEIQQVPGWDRFVRRVSESVSSKIFVTGSSSTLLGGEVAAALRGRALSYRLLPYSFREYLRWRQLDADDLHGTRNRNRLMAAFLEFTMWGGYPEVIELDEETRIRTLQSYVDIMLYRDLIERHGIRHVHVLRDMTRRFMGSFGRTFSAHKFYQELRSRGVAVTKDVIYRYLEHFADAFFVIPLRKYDPSVAKQEQAQKKIYLCDTGFVRAFRYAANEDRGFVLENVVLLELFKREKEVFFLANGRECDLLVRQSGRVAEAIQVCHRLDDDNRGREEDGLAQAMKRFGLKEGWLVTWEQEETRKRPEGRIHVIPAWKWILAKFSS